MGSLARRKATASLIEDMRQVCAETQLVEVVDSVTRVKAFEALAEMKQQVQAFEAASNVGISSFVDALDNARGDQKELLGPINDWVKEQERLINGYDAPRIEEHLQRDKEARLFSLNVAKEAEKETGIFVAPEVPKLPSVIDGTEVTWGFKVTDESLVPERYIVTVPTISKPRIMEVLEMYGTATEIPGIEVTWSIKPKTRIKRKKKKETAQTETP